MLTAGFGTASADLGGLFMPGSKAWAFMPTISLPIFDGGRRRANLNLSEVRRDIAVADYERTIQTVFREVADALSARRWLSKELTVQTTARQAQTERARLAKLRYDNGSAAYLEVLDAQRALLDVEQQLVQTRRALVSSQITLYSVLGGGAGTAGRFEYGGVSNIPAGRMVGLIGPDGVGKSTLLSLLSGAKQIQEGHIDVLSGDMADKNHRDVVCPRIAYMPQGLGKNLYHTLSVEENLQFFARLFGHDAQERRRRIDDLTRSTGLYTFLDRPAGKLSGGMKQKLGLCCALIHDPDFLLLDEPTTGVDPLARAQFWDLIDRIWLDRPSMSVIVATAYMDEAQRFDWIVTMDEGRVLATGTPRELLDRTNSANLGEAFIRLLPEEKRQGYEPVVIPPLDADEDDIAIEAQDLTMRFGDFTAVDHVSFRIHRGEIFGFLGSNGCGKSTTMKMLTGLLPASSRDIETRRRVGYMSQAFSLYSEFTVKQNLVLHAQLFHVPADEVDGRVKQVVEQFGLDQALHRLPDTIPLGMRQRLSLAVAMVHKPDMLILDEPTSGVDPVARDNFWCLLIELSRRDKVTIFISTHFMNEAERCSCQTGGKAGCRVAGRSIYWLLDRGKRRV